MTISIKIECQTNIPEDYYRQFNNVKRFAYNRFREDMTENEVRRCVKATMNNIELMDCALIESAVTKAKSLTKVEGVIFGKQAFIKRKWHKGNDEETIQQLEEQRNPSLYFRGRRDDCNGNRKVQLDIINNRIIIKWNRKTHFTINIPTPKQKVYDQLLLLQTLCERHEACATLDVKRDSISITFDESILKTKPHLFMLCSRVVTM